MEPIRGIFSSGVAAVLLLMLTANLVQSEVICTKQRVKPIHHVCGIVIDQTGAPMAHAKLTILQEGTQLASRETGGDGKFSFDQLKAGNYDVQAQEEGFHSFRFPIVLLKPVERCERALEVELTVGSEACSGVRLVKPAVVERRLHTSQ